MDSAGLWWQKPVIMRRSSLCPDIQNTEAIKKFSGRILAICIAKKMTPEAFAQICHEHGMKFIYGSACDLNLTSPGCNDDKPMFWVYMSDLFNPKFKAQLSPII